MLKHLLHYCADKLYFLKQSHRYDLSATQLIKLLHRLSLHLKANVQHLGDSLLEEMHLLHQVPKVMRLLYLSALE